MTHQASEMKLVGKGKRKREREKTKTKKLREEMREKN
jgi:hypothetical protein